MEKKGVLYMFSLASEVAFVHLRSISPFGEMYIQDHILLICVIQTKTTLQSVGLCNFSPVRVT